MHPYRHLLKVTGSCAKGRKISLSTLSAKTHKEKNMKQKQTQQLHAYTHRNVQAEKKKAKISLNALAIGK